MNIQTEDILLSTILAIIGDRKGMSKAEQNVLSDVIPSKDHRFVEGIIESIHAGQDPLGDIFSAVRSAAMRRGYGQIFTPTSIITSMMSRAKIDAVSNGDYSTVVDPGAGSGRFIIQAGMLFPEASLIAVESDPVCALILRANLTILGMTSRTRVIVDDFRSVKKLPIGGRTLFIGNPPYVRHHDISEQWKAWYADTTSSLGSRGSKLAGLHIHFFIQTFLLSKPGDLVLFVTSAEWMETKYGKTLRVLLAGQFGGLSIHVVDAKSEPFPGVMTTAAITAFHPHIPSDTILFCKVDEATMLNDLMSGHEVPSDQLITPLRWSAEQHILFPPRRAGGTRVGDLFRVSRGQVTGCNAAWIAGPQAADLPSKFLVPCIVSAKEIFEAAESGGRLVNLEHLHNVVCLPQQMEQEPPNSRRKIEKFLKWVRQVGGDKSYIAQHRSPWWSVVLHQPAPIICTYMARKCPAFIRNDAGAGILNVAHGLYPKVALTSRELDEICVALNSAVKLADGRVYAGGLTKFEPKAVEGLYIDWEQESNEMEVAI